MIWLLFACESTYGIKEHNSAPTANIYSHENDMELTVGATEVFLANIVDLNDPLSSLSIEWFYGEDVVCPDTYIDENNDTFCELTIEEGKDYVRVVVRDSSNSVGDDRVDFDLFQNTLPTAPLIEVSPEEPTSIDDVTALATATDANGDTLSYVFSWHLVDDEMNVVSTSNQLSSEHTVKGDTWVVNAYAEDEYGSGPSSSLQIGILNGPPVIDGIEIAPSTGVYNDSVLTCTASAEDPDAESEQVFLEYKWMLNGQIIGSEQEVTLDPAVVEPTDEVICVVTATDTELASASSQTSVTVENRELMVNGSGLTPASPTVNDTLEFWVDVTDPDLQEPSIAYSWTVNGQAVTGNTMNLSSQFVKLDTVEVVATITDGVDTQQASGSTVIVNSTPTTPTVVVSPSTPMEGDDLYCDLDVPSTDADGDTINYLVSWTKNGSTYSGPTSTTNLPDDTVPGSQVALNDNWSCEIYADDGVDSVNSGPQSFTTVNGWCTYTVPQTCYNTVSTTNYGRHSSCGVNGSCVWCCNQDYIDPDCEGWCNTAIPGDAPCPNWHAEYYNECTYTETSQVSYDCSYTTTDLCN